MKHKHSPNFNVLTCVYAALCLFQSALVLNTIGVFDAYIF